MKKIIVTMIVILILVSASTGCVQQSDIAPEVSEQPMETATPTIMPTPTPEPTFESISEETPEVSNFQKLTGGEGPEEIIALLGEPDKIVPNPAPDAESAFYFYGKYNRVFIVGIGGPNSDVTNEFETVKGVKLSMSAKEVIKKLGKPSTKDEAGFDEELDGWYQTWRYQDLGVGIRMFSEKKDMRKARAISITINKNLEVKLSSGIGIGSTKDEVIEKYCAGMYIDDEISDDQIIIGEMYHGITFDLENGKAVEILIN